MGRRRSRTDFRAGMCAATVALLVATGCGGQVDSGSDGTTSAEATSADRPPLLEPVPPGTEYDGLTGLPVTDSSASLLVSTIDDTEPLRLLDLDAGTVDAVPGVTDSMLATFTPSGEVIVADSPRTMTVLDPATGASRQVALPDEVAGELGFIDADAERFVVWVEGPDESTGRTIVLGRDGALQCVGPENIPFSLTTPDTAQERSGTNGASVLFSYDSGTQLDPRTCEAGEPLENPAEASITPLLVDGDTVFAAMTTGDETTGYDTSVGRFDLRTGALVATSPAIDGDTSRVLPLRDGLWLLGEGTILRLDARTLELEATADMPEDVTGCGGVPFLFVATADAYLVDDCSLTLWLLDPETGRATRGWAIPSDEVSDSEISAVSSVDGIWMVDVEQTGLPYLFDTEEQRFERLPDGEMSDESIYALDFHVHDGGD